jgi:hypothetical protein
VNPYRDEIRTANAAARSASWRLGIWAAVITLFLFALGMGVWWLKVQTSDARGAGDQTRITNDGRNRVNAQEWFQSQYGLILSADKNLDEAKANLDKHPNDDFYQTNFTGLKNRCNEMVANYNAEAGKVSRGQWRAPALPFQIDDSDPKTDCQPKVEATP